MIIEGKEQKELTEDTKSVRNIPRPSLTASDGTLSNAVIRIQEIYEALRMNGIVK